MNDNQSPWYALYCLNDTKAAHVLMEAGFEVYAPTYNRVALTRGRKRLVTTPLVPRYVFCRIPGIYPHGFSEALASEHVLYAVGANDTAQPVPEAIMYGLMQLKASSRYDEKLPPPAPPPPPPIKSKKRGYNKNRARGFKKRGLEALHVWFEEAVQPAAKVAA